MNISRYSYNILGRESNVVATLIGNDKNQIIKTIKYYLEERGEAFNKLDIPSEDEIKSTDSGIFYLDPVFDWTDFTKGTREKAPYQTAVTSKDVVPKLVVRLNENSLRGLKKLIKKNPNIEEMLRGGLYKFGTNLRLYYVPREIIESIFSYSWEELNSRVS